MREPISLSTLADAPQINGFFFENVLNLYSVDGYPHYNIGKSVKFDLKNTSSEYLEFFYVDRDMPWTTLSFKLYGTQHLWWVIVLVNGLNPIFNPERGTTIAAIKPQYISYVLDSIKKQKQA